MTASGIAVHEAGHAVVGIVLGFRLAKVTIRPEGDDAPHHLTGGTTHWELPLPPTPAKGVVDWAGPLATRYLTSDGQVENENDADIVRLGALALILEPDADPMILAEQWYQRAYELLSEHRGAVYRVAAALDERGALTEAEVRALIARE